jgi:hypothetical protein
MAGIAIGAFQQNVAIRDVHRLGMVVETNTRVKCSYTLNVCTKCAATRNTAAKHSCQVPKFVQPPAPGEGTSAA